LAPQHVAGSMRIRRFALCWKGNPSFNRVEQILIVNRDRTVDCQRTGISPACRPDPVAGHGGTGRAATRAV
jgi:hypothetical protein